MRKGFKGFMNKVFKVVYSKSKGCYVVVPETAKNNNGKKKVLASVLAGLAVAGVVGGIAPQQAMAGVDTGNSHVNIWADTNPKSNGQNYNVGQNSIVVGYQNTTDNVAGHDGKVAIGAKNTSTNNASTAVGNENKATGGAATAVGAGNTASGKASVALGNVNNADAKAAIAIGTYNNVNYTKGSWQTTPKHAGEYSTVVGNYSSATGTSASAMGVYTNATGAGSFAAGYNNNANGQNSVAIGSENTSHVADTVTLGQFNNAKTMGGISIGKNNLTDSSNDGRNAANTRDENSQIAIGRDNVATHLDTIAIGRETTASGSGSTVVGARAEASGDNSIAIGQSGKGSPKVIASGVNSIAIGMQSQATGEAAIAEGAGSRAGGKYGVALGRTTKANAEAATALGNAAEANIANGVALGSSSVTTTDKGVKGYNPSDDHTRHYTNLANNVRTATTAAVSIGNGSTLTRQLTGLAAGTADTDAVNVAQLKNVGVAVTGNTGSSDFLADGGKLNVIGEGRVSTVAAHDGAKDSKITVGFDDKGMVKAGKNVKVDEVTVNGKTTYTIHAADAAAKYDFLTNAKANGGKLDGTATPTKVESGTTVSYAAGKNLTVKQDINQSAGEQTYTYSLNKDLKEITSITNNGGPTLNFGDNNISVTGGNLDLGDQNITHLHSGGDTVDNAANIGDVIRISKANDLHIAPTAGTNNNVAEYTVDANKKVTLTYQDGNGKTVNGPKAVIDLSGLKTGDMSSFNVKSSATEGKVAQGSAGVQEIRDGKTVEMQAGKNMTIKQTNKNGNAAVEFALNKDIDLTPDGSIKIGDTNITDNGLTINGGPSITKTGINAGGLSITNVKAGVNDNDAVNVSQLKQVRADERHIKPGEYAVDANGKVTMTYLDGNNKDVANETAVITGIAKQDLSNINKGGETVIQNLAKKSIDMENGKNTKVSNREINGVKTFKVDVEGDLNDITSITNKAGDGKVVFGGNQTVNVAGDHNINLNAKVGDITGLTNVTLDAPDFAKKGRAATEEQLKIVNNGFNNTVGLTGNTGATELQKLNKQGGLSFGVVGANNGQYITTTAAGSNVVADLSADAKNKLNSTVVVEGKNAAKVSSRVETNTDGSTKTIYTVDVNNVKPTAASTEKVQAKADVAGSSDKNIAKVAPKAGENFGDAGATYEVNVSRNDVKDAAREAITVNTSNTTNNPITVTPVQDETNHNTTYTVTFDGNKAATQIPLTYKANGQNAQTVTLDKGLNFTNGRNTTASVDAEGVVKYDLNNNIDLTPNGSLKIGDTIVNNGGLTISGGPSITKTGINAGNLNITNVKAGVNNTDAVNVQQLKDARTLVTSNDNSVTINKTESGNQITYDLHVAPGAAQSVWNVKSSGNTTADSEATAKTITDGKTVEMVAGKNLTVKQTSNNDGAKVEYALSDDIKVGNDGKDGKPGKDGSIGVNGKDGSSVVINGKDGSIGLNGKDGKDGLTMKAENGQPGVNGKDGITRIVYEDKTNTKHEVATLDDGLKFTGNNTDTVNNHKLNSLVKVQGEGVDKTTSATFKSAAGNINVTADGTDTLEVQLNKDLKNITTIKNDGPATLTIGGNEFKFSGGNVNMGDNNITNLKSGGDVINNAANIGDVKRISKANDLHIAPTTSDRAGETTATYAYNTADKSVTLKYNDGNGTTQTGTIAKIDLSGLADQIKDGYSFSTDAKGNVVGNHAVTAVGNGKTVSYAAGDNLTVAQHIDNATGEQTYTYALSNDIKVGNDGKDGKPGVDGKIGVNGKDGSAVVINGKDGSIGLNGKDGKDGLTMKAKDGQPGVNGKDGITRIVYEDNSKNTHEVATLDDGMKYAGDDAQGADKSKLTDNNIGVNNVDGKLKVQLSKEVNLTPSGSLTIGDTVVNNNGLTISGGPSITKTGINAGNKTIVNVDAGVNDTDAVNVQQLKKAKTEVKAGNNVTVDTTYGNDGHTIYTVNANDVALGDAVLKYSANGTNTQSVKLSQGLNFVDGNYTSASVDANGQVKYDVTIGKVKDGVDGKPGVDGKDGIATVKTVVDTINNSGWKGDVTGNTVNNHAATIVKPGTTVNFGAGKNLTVEQIVDQVTGNHTYNYALSDDIKVGHDGKDGKPGVDGKIGVNGKDGSSVVINGKDGSIGLNGKDGKDGLTMKAKDGQPGVNGKDGITRIVYEDNSKNTHEVATLDDGMKYAGDDAQGTDKSKVIAKKLNQTMDIVGGANSTKLTDNNIGVNNVDGKLKVQLAQNIDLTPAGSLTIGGTSITDNGLVINQGPSITKGGINAGNQFITNVKAGVNNTDAVNVAQLKSAKTEVEEGDNVKVTSRTGADGQTIYKVSAKAVNLGDAELKYSANGTNTQSVKLSQGLNFVDGNYTTASVDANGQVKYDVTIGKVKDGVDGKPGVDGKDGIATVKTVVDTINNSGWKANATGNVVGNSTATIVKPGNTVNYGAGKNLNVKQTVNGDEQTYEFALDKDLKELNSVQTKNIYLGSPTSHTTITYNNDNSRIEYTTKEGDKKQVANLDDIWTIQANGTDVKPVGGKVNVVGGNHIKVSTDAAGKMTISADGLGTMNGFNVKSTGNTTSDSDKTAKNITDGKTVEFSGGKNLTVKQTNTADGAKVEFALNNNIDLTPNGSVTIGDTVVNNDGLTITGGPTITKNNVDMGGQQIHNVKSGGDVDSNGANIGDIKRISKANDTRIKDGNYEVSQNGTVEMTYVDGAGKQVVDANGNPVKATISGIARQDLSNITNEGKKVITGLSSIVKGGNNVTVDTSVDNTTGQKTYTVNADLSGAKVNASVGADGSGVAKGLKNPVKVEKGTQYIAGDNMVVERKPVEGDDKIDNSITYSLAHDLTEIRSISNGGATLRINSDPGSVPGDRAPATPAFEVHGGNLSMTGNRIVNLAPGIDGTDGVNVDQLKGSRTTLTSEDNSVTLNRTDNGQGGYNYDLSVKGVNDPRVNILNEEIGLVGAQGAALSALKPMQYDPMEPTQIMAGYGNYRGNSALALGVAHYKNESTMFHGGISWAGGSSHMMANAGVTWKIGNRDSEGAVADRYRKGPISSTYAMQTEVASMKAQNAGLKGEVSDLKAENEQIKAQNAGLQNEVDQLKAQMAAMMARLGM